ncbi:DcaP family trimeric outer membrane transporter [Aporhodopirellula aestuarii]|uniref:DcaP family trimeric outer membrane transporter n=1 Tax=Aporhodopirellula aestuarii TaxID=2950107 RepID=A0ABT0TYX9_9BACT|nr:DcaP family trimeric outer membrane transporter [Aporhodopirellula aestuarii]MCM2369443.1 DcaP family trimeric outer membrane transporter [Aporhodopirellula aestuarii]
MPFHNNGVMATAMLWLLLTSGAQGQFPAPATDLPVDLPVGMIADDDIDTSMTDQPTIAVASFLQTVAAPLDLSVRGRSSLLTQAFTSPERLAVGLDLYSAPDFANGVIVAGENIAMKIGGFVKADFIYDFAPIDSTDSFVTTSIPVGAPPRTNARFHARQTRLSFDTRWVSDEHTIRIFVEGDFFGDGNQYRLRHAYGEVGSLLVGQTWTTFTDVASAPATLDFEGSVSSVNRRQAQARWTQPLLGDDLTLALAIEDTQFNIEPPVGVTGDPRSQSPDFVGHLRLKTDLLRFQAAGLYRVVGFQPTGAEVLTRDAWGFNFAGSILLTERSKVYSQIVFGEGIGSYRGLPDAAPTAVDQGDLLPLFGWMVGYTQDWNDDLSSNLTYAENSLDNTAFQDPDDVHRTTYLAANLIWSPLERVKVGIEYLYGTRENVDRASAPAHRIQTAVIFDLP